MSATAMPGTMPSARTSWPDSSAPSRSGPVDQIGETIPATGRSAFGNPPLSLPDAAAADIPCVAGCEQATKVKAARRARRACIVAKKPETRANASLKQEGETERELL